jgi:hypothetical protein
MRSSPDAERPSGGNRRPLKIHGLGVDEDDSRALIGLSGLVHRIARRLEVLEHRVDLLADHAGVSLDELEARYEVDRLGDYVTSWRVLEAPGIDPTTGEATG